MGDSEPRRRKRKGSDPQVPTHVYDALGHAIKVERTARRIDRRKLADTSGLSYPYLSEIENGTKRPSAKALMALAQALGVHISDLLRAAESWAAEQVASGARNPTRMITGPVDVPYLRSDGFAVRSRWFHDEAPPDDRRGRIDEILTAMERLDDEALETLRVLVRRLASS